MTQSVCRDPGQFAAPPRRFSMLRQNRSQEQELPGLELGYDLDPGYSPRKRGQGEGGRGEQLPTPRYMDWYIRQQQQQHEQLRQRQLELQQQQEATKQRMKLKQRHQHQLQLGQEAGDQEPALDELEPDDSVSNGGDAEPGETDDDKMRRLSTAERREQGGARPASAELSSSLELGGARGEESSEATEPAPDILALDQDPPHPAPRPHSAEVLLSTK